jgi:hypothetical protein
MMPVNDSIKDRILEERSTYIIIGLRKDMKKDALGFYTNESESSSY